MISKNSLKQILKKTDEKAWKFFQNDQISIRWLPIFRLEEYRGDIGLLDDGTWIFVTNEAMKVLDHTENFFVIHPLLRKERTEVIKQFLARFKEVGLPEVVVKTFPFDKLMVSAIYDTGEWIALVIDWLEKGYPPNDMIADAFSKMGGPPAVVYRWQKERLEKIVQI